MKDLVIAPCGLVCDLCRAFQREQKRCTGCQVPGGYKAGYCDRCSIVLCQQKIDKPGLQCYQCQKYPCRRLRDLDKRYSTRYAESLVANFELLQTGGRSALTEAIVAKWTCQNCGSLLSVHDPTCLTCRAINPHFPGKSQPKNSKAIS